jgi:zinc transport system substrate-binding protein
MNRAARLATLVLVGASVCACTSSPSNNSGGRIIVAASLFPIAEITTRVGGDVVDVVTLTPPGSDAHDVELTAKQIQKLGDSDVVFFFGDGFQPGAQKAIESLNNSEVVDLFDEVELLDSVLRHDDHNDGSHGDHDPHVWLDPANMIAMTNRVVDSLSDISPANADMFAANGAAYVSELTQLGDYLDTSLGQTLDDPAQCATTTVYTAHQGFTYLAHRAGLDLVPIAGVNPDEQVSAQYLEELADELQGKNITIFFESLIPSSTAQTLADALNVRTDHLNPLEGLSQADIDAGVTYVSAQRENIDKIATALGCA